VFTIALWIVALYVFGSAVTGVSAFTGAVGVESGLRHAVWGV